MWHSTILEKTFMKKTVDERNTMIQNDFSRLFKSLAFQRRYVPELMQHPETGEIGIKMIRDGHIDAGTFYPSIGAIHGEKIKNRNGHHDSFRGVKNIDGAYEVINKLCYREDLRAQKYFEMYTLEIWKKNKLNEALDEMKKKYETCFEERARLEERLSILYSTTEEKALNTEAPAIAESCREVRNIKDGPGIPESDIDVAIEVDRFLSSLDKCNHGDENQE